MTKLLIAALPLLALSACATPEARLRTGLNEAGLSRAQSACMADRMADKLSIGQLLKLRSLAGLRDKNLKTMTMPQFLRNVRALGDLEILAITTRAAVGCAV